jgi:prepilin signal peptidase PulO-like enzyme (type II secretory pathway)
VIVFGVFCALAGAAGGWLVDAWIRRAAAREAELPAPVGVLTGADAALAARIPDVPLDRHLTHDGAGRVVVPVLSALGCLLVGLRYGPSLVVVPFLFLVPVLAGLAVVDLHTHRLPNALTLPSYAIGVALVGGTALARGEPAALVSALVAAALLFLVVLVLALVRPAGMGMGDVKASGLVGLFVGSLGVGAAIVAVFVGAVLSLVAGGVLMATGRIDRRTPTPFGPWLAVGALVAVLAGPALWAGYVSSVT